VTRVYKTNLVPAITEVTILHQGGFTDPNKELALHACAADAIVCEVHRNMAKAVAKPIPLKSGRWSVQPRSKGNFVYSFDGNIPFNQITPYEHILLAPFKGYGQLCPSLGWTRLIMHGVPFRDDLGIIFGPGTLIQETQTLPGLKKAYFAMPPRWLKPAESINSDYSSITFAISDPDGSISSKLMQGRMALFGKEVTVKHWVDKPVLVQCSRCHALGHTKASKVCPLSANSFKCFRCGGAHRSEEHNQKCPWKHAVAGVCDCSHLKCLNCQGTDHHCRDAKCPARSLFCPNTARKNRRAREKGKQKVADLMPAEGTELWEEQHINAGYDSDDELFNHPPSPPHNPSVHQPRASDEPGAPPRVHWSVMAPQPMDYSSSRLQGSATAGPSTQ